MAISNYDIGSHPPDWDISLTDNHRRTVTYSISPDISDLGLSFNNSTGEISGIITNFANLTNTYTVTAKPAVNSQAYVGTSSTFTVYHRGIDLATLALSYSDNDITVITNQMFQSSPNWSNTNRLLFPLTVSYQVDPSLPVGVSLDVNTGQISGTLTVRDLTTNYNVIATGNELYSGSKTSSLTITVGHDGDMFLNDLSFSYSNIGVDYSNGNEVYTINISNTPNPTIPISSPL